MTNSPSGVKTIPRCTRISTTQYLVTDAPEHKLVLASQHGDQTAFNTLLLRHREDAYKLAHRILFKPNGRLNANQTADDVVQDASIFAWKYIRSCDPPRFRAWFRGIVRNECLKLFKELAKEVKNIDIYTDIDRIGDVGNWMVDKNELQEHPDEYEGLAQLPPTQHKIMRLKLDGHSRREIAKITGLSLLAVDKNLYRARRTIRCAIKNQLFSPQMS